MLTMVKNKQKLNKNQYKITVLFGYGLFAFTVLTLIFSTIIPFGSALFYPTARHLSIIVLLIAFIAVAILPALLAYILGDKATHAKNKNLHHYNGVLFAVASYWLAFLFSSITYGWYMEVSQLQPPFSSLVGFLMPIVLAIAVMMVVAIAYAKKQKGSVSVLEYRPYQLVLAGSIVAFMLDMLRYQDVTNNTILISLAYTIIPVILTAVSYWVLPKAKASRWAHFTDALIAMSFATISATLISTAIAYMDLRLPYTVESWIAYSLALVIWLTYLYFRRRK